MVEAHQWHITIERVQTLHPDHMVIVIDHVTEHGVRVSNLLTFSSPTSSPLTHAVLMAIINGAIGTDLHVTVQEARK